MEFIQVIHDADRGKFLDGRWRDAVESFSTNASPFGSLSFQFLQKLIQPLWDPFTMLFGHLTSRQPA